MMPRTLEPELLDSLPPDHPDAVQSRRDLRLINRLMRNHHWLVHTLPALLRPGETVLELGAGTGELGLRLAARGLAVDGLDLWPRPTDWPAERAWHSADLVRFAGYGDYPVILGNLIFHQFSDDQLTALGSALRRSARVILACEPSRRKFSQACFALLGPVFGVNDVTLHDAHVSIAAGFHGDELPRALGLETQDWAWHCTTTTLGAYHMVAFRRD